MAINCFLALTPLLLILLLDFDSYNFQQSMAKYQNIPDGTYELKEEHVEDAAELLVSTFTRKNVVWSNANGEHLKFKQFFIDTINHHLEFQKRAQKALGKKTFYNTISLEDGHMTSCSLHYDIGQYKLILAEKNVPKIPLFAKLEHYGSKLLENIDLSLYETGKAVYASFGGRSTQRRVPKISSVMMLGEIYALMKADGYRYVIGRVSSYQLRELYEKLGMKEVASVAMDIGNGRQHNLYLVLLDMENPTFLKIAQEIKEFREKEKKITPKL